MVAPNRVGSSMQMPPGAASGSLNSSPGSQDARPAVSSFAPRGFGGGARLRGVSRGAVHFPPVDFLVMG